MKKMFFLGLLLIVMPMFVHAATLVQGINFDGIGELGLSRNTWNLNLTTSLDYVDIDVIPANDTVTVTGAGKVDVVEGDNTIVFTATDGTTTETYTVHVKINRPSGDGSANPETGAFVSVTMIGIGILVGFTMLRLKKAKMIRI